MAGVLMQELGVWRAARPLAAVGLLQTPVLKSGGWLRTGAFLLPLTSKVSPGCWEGN